MAPVMVLQVPHDYSDVEAAEAARCDLRWKAACGLPLDHGGFDASILADAVATQDTITQLIAAVRTLRRAAEQVGAVYTGHDYRSPANLRSAGMIRR
jgi:hypothetical protein